MPPPSSASGRTKRDGARPADEGEGEADEVGRVLADGDRAFALGDLYPEPFRVVNVPVREERAKVSQDDGILPRFGEDPVGFLYDPRPNIVRAVKVGAATCGQIAAGDVQRVTLVPEDGVFPIVGFDLGSELGEGVGGEEPDPVTADGDPPVAKM